MRSFLLSTAVALAFAGSAHAASFGGGNISAGVTNTLTGESGAGMAGNMAVTHKGFADAIGAGVGASSLSVTPTSINTVSVGSGSFHIDSSLNGGANVQFEALGDNNASVKSFGGFNAAAGFTNPN